MSIEDTTDLLRDLIELLESDSKLVGWTHVYPHTEYPKMRATRALMEYGGFKSKTSRIESDDGTFWRLNLFRKPKED